MMVALVAVAAFALQTSFRALNDATATATAEDWNITAGAYAMSGSSETNLAGQTAQVDIDGNNVTISVSVFSMTVSLTGTKSGSTVTFPKGQEVVSTYGTFYLVGSNTAMTSVSDIEFAYDETNQKLTQTTERIIASVSPTAASGMAYLRGIVLENPNGGTSTGSHYYQKVTSTSDIADGEYLIVYEGNSTHDAVAFNGALTTLDASGNGVGVSIADGAIASSETIDAAVFTIDVTNGTLKSASGNYIGVSTNSNGLKQSTDATTYTNSFSIDNSGNAVIAAAFDESTMSLRYNYASGQTRFRYYSNSGQQPIALYKKVAGEMPVAEFNYYVVGNMTEWAPEADYKMAKNTAADGEEYMLTMEFNAGDEIKVVKSTDGTTAAVWYPDPGENYTINTAGEYTVYFRPNGDGGSDWHYNVIYVAATPINTIAEAQAAQAGTTMTVEGTVVASAANGAVLYDGTDYIYYYNSSNALELYHKVRMKGALGAYGGANQFTNSATVTDLGVVDYTDPDPVLLDGAGLNAIAAAGTVTRQFVALKGHLTISGNYYNVTVEGAEGVQASLVKPKEDLTSLNDKDVVIYGYAMYMTGNTNKYVYIVATIVGEPDVLEPVVWPEGVEGEQWKITTTATQTGGATQNIVGEPCQVAYLADAAEAYLQAPFTLQGRQFVVTLKGSVDGDLNVTIPLGQLVAQDEQTGMNAFIFAKNADQEFTDVVLTYSKTAEKQSLKYEGSIYLYLTPDPGSTDVPVFTLTNTEVFKEVIYDYYVVGNMNDWAPNENFKMTKNTEAEGVEEYMFTMNLTTENQFKVVRVKNGNIQNWYPSGIDNNYGQNGEITADGEYTIYFRPNGDGGDDWFYNFIYVAASAEPLPELPGDVIWSSNTPVVLPANWDGEVAPRVAADKFADANAGDVLHIAVQDVTAGSAWSAQVAPFAQNWTQIENGFPVGTGDISDAYFTVTGDMLRLLKANGLIIFGAGYSTRLATLERNVYPGSEYSIWLGDKTLTWTQASVDKLHLNNAGVEAGMTLKLSYEATGNPNIQLVYGWGQGENYGQVTYGDGFATLEVTEDMLENLTTKGLIVNADGIRLTQIELLPAEEPEPDMIYLIGDQNGWDRMNPTAMTIDDNNNYTYNVEPDALFYFAVTDKALTEEEVEADPNWEDYNANHRWAIGEGNVNATLNEEVQLQKINGTIVLQPGSYTITITPEMKMTITGEGAPTLEDGYYVVGNMNDWTPNADYKMTQNTEAGEGVEEYMFNMDLTTTSMLKVVKVEGTQQTWYPDGEGNAYGENGEIAEDGEYNIYFRPNGDGGDDWFYNVIFVAPVGDEPNPLLAGEFIYWTEDDICSAGAAQPTYGSDSFYMTCVDTDGKQAVDANNAYFGDANHQLKFTHRFKTGGKGSNKNSITLTVPSDGQLSVYVRTGSNSATDRNLVLKQGETELYNQVVQEADAIEVAPEDLNADSPGRAEGDPVKVYPIITVDVVAGEVVVDYPIGSLNFYAFQFVSGTTGIVNIMPEQKPMFDETLPAYNLQGQRVTKSYRGIVIQNGRKFYNK